MDTRQPHPHTMVDVIAFYNAATTHAISQGIERNRLIAAVTALREADHSIRDIAGILNVSYGTVTRVMTHQLVAGHSMPHWSPNPYASNVIPDWLYTRTWQILDAMVWRHSPQAVEHFPSELRSGEFSAAWYAREHALTFACEPDRKPSVLDDISAPLHHLRSPLPVTAQGVAHALGYQIDGGGHIYDQDGVWVARDLEQLAAALVDLEWIAPLGANVDWEAFLEAGGETPRDGVDDKVRQAVSKHSRRSERH